MKAIVFWTDSSAVFGTSGSAVFLTVGSAIPLHAGSAFGWRGRSLPSLCCGAGKAWLMLGMMLWLAVVVPRGSVHAQAPALDLRTWLADVAAEQDTAWLIVADAQALANCKLGIIQGLLAGTEGHPRAFLFGAERKATIQASLVYQLGLDPERESTIRDPMAQDSLYRFPTMHKLLVRRGLLRSTLDGGLGNWLSYPPDAAGIDSIHPAWELDVAGVSMHGLDSARTSWKKWETEEIHAAVDSLVLDETNAAFSRAALFTDGGAAGWLVLDYFFHRLHRIDSATGKTTAMLAFSESYPAFYQAFSWTNPVSDSLLEAYADVAHPYHAAMRPEAPNLSVFGEQIYLAFYRRIPVREPGGGIGLYLRPFLYRLDTALQITGRASGRAEDLPAGTAWRSQHLLAWSDTAGVVTCLSLDDTLSRADSLHPTLLAAYTVDWSDQRWELGKPFPVRLPDVLGLGKGHTGFARGFLAGDEQHWSFAFALAAQGRVFPGPSALAFLDTGAHRRNTLQTPSGGVPSTPWTVAGLARWPDGGWVYWEQDADHGDRLVRVSPEGRACLAWIPVPRPLQTVFVHLAHGHAYGLRSRGEDLYLYHWRLPRQAGAWRSF